MDVKCPLCAVVMEEQAEEDCLACPRCLTRARFRGEELEALNIPGYRARLMELERMNVELMGRIEQEGSKREARDRGLLQALHAERQRVLSEYGFLSYFSGYQEKWG